MMAVAAGATPDWSTLEVHGPTPAPGRPDVVWFEWTATVTADGGAELDDALLDAAMPTSGLPVDWLDLPDFAPPVAR